MSIYNHLIVPVWTIWLWNNYETKNKKPSFEIKWLYLQVKRESCYAPFFIYILKI